MDLFVLPTTSDMSPFAISEAATAGLPIVSSAIGGIGELVRDGVTGILCSTRSTTRRSSPPSSACSTPAAAQVWDRPRSTARGRHSTSHTVMSKFVDGILDLVR